MAAKKDQTTGVEQQVGTLFLCEKYPEIHIQTPSGLIPFVQGKLLTNDDAVIECIRGCSSFQEGAIVEAGTTE